MGLNDEVNRFCGKGKPVAHLDPKEVISTLGRALEMAKNGEFVEIMVIGKTAKGEIYSTGSRSYGMHEMAGRLLDAAIMRLGYETREG